MRFSIDAYPDPLEGCTMCVERVTHQGLTSLRIQAMSIVIELARTTHKNMLRFKVVKESLHADLPNEVIGHVEIVDGLAWSKAMPRPNQSLFIVSV